MDLAERLVVSRSSNLEFALWLFGPGGDSLWVTLSSSLEIPNPGLGEAVRFLRENANLSQEEVSAKSNLHATHISQLEQGRGNPTHKTLHSLAKALDVPPSYILVLEDIFERKRHRQRRDS
jgi:DNA-binding XRE family transcriptional regulator